MGKSERINAESIKRMIENLGFKQVEVSRMMGLKDNSLSAMLSAGTITSENLERLAIFLRVPKETLISQEGGEKKEPAPVTDGAKESTLQTVLLSLTQLQKSMTELADEITAMRTCQKNYFVNTAKWQDKLFNQIRYDPTKVK